MTNPKLKPRESDRPLKPDVSPFDIIAAMNAAGPLSKYFEARRI
jgi:hypothetical protein